MPETVGLPGGTYRVELREQGFDGAEADPSIDVDTLVVHGVIDRRAGGTVMADPEGNEFCVFTGVDE